ncbi:hypothetical protein CRM22_010914, partial [Opisthorchis felineus]
RFVAARGNIVGKRTGHRPLTNHGAEGAAARKLFGTDADPEEIEYTKNIG